MKYKYLDPMGTHRVEVPSWYDKVWAYVRNIRRFLAE